MKLKTFFSWGKRKVNSGNFQDVLPNLGLPLICVESWNPWWNFFATQHWRWLNLDLLFDDGLIFLSGKDIQTFFLIQYIGDIQVQLHTILEKRNFKTCLEVYLFYLVMSGTCFVRGK